MIKDLHLFTCQKKQLWYNGTECIYGKKLVIVCIVEIWRSRNAVSPPPFFLFLSKQAAQVLLHILTHAFTHRHTLHSHTHKQTNKQKGHAQIWG